MYADKRKEDENSDANEHYLFDNQMHLVEYYGSYYDYCNDEGYYDISEDCYAHINMPFQKGDIIKQDRYNETLCYGVMISESESKENDRRLACGDATDMVKEIKIYMPNENRYEYEHIPVLEMYKCSWDEVPENMREKLKEVSKEYKGKVEGSDGYDNDADA